MSDFNIEFEENDMQITLDFSGSGIGGTTDYNDLENKPSINNVTLTGNKSASDLGLGTYTKPSGGIPASDIASGVIPAIDATLTTTGAAADAKKVGDEISDLKDDFINSLIVDTASGAIASFPDGANGLPVKALTVAVEPVQDLHGQANPYPAGGGANKLGLVTDIDKTVSGVQFTYDADTGLFTVSGTNTNTSAHQAQVWLASGSSKFPDFQVGETYTLFVDNTTLSMYMQFTYKTASNVTVSLGYCVFSYGHISFTVPENFDHLYDFQMYINGTATTVDGTFHVWLVEGTVSSSTFSPYENICPISGHTQAKVTRTGVNLIGSSVLSTKTNGNVTFTPQTTVPVVSLSGTSNANFPYYICPNGTNVSKSNAGFVLPAGTYTFSATKSDGTKLNLDGTIGIFYWEGSSDTRQIVQANNSNVTSVSVTSAETLYMTPTFSGASGKATGFDVYLQLEVGSTASDFAPYNGQTYAIDLDGTRYGGTLDVTTGVLTVDRALITLDGSTDENWMASGSKFYSTAMLDTETNAQAVSNQYKYSGIAGGGSSTVLIDKSFYLQPANNRIWVYDTGHSDLTSFKTALGNNPLVVAYEIATPTTVQLSANEVSTLLGQNNIWADTGDSTVEYYADTKLYIEKLTAPTEDDMVADHAISSGSFFMVGNTLYRAITAIASGATITVGTNATRMSLSDALNALS